MNIHQNFKNLSTDPIKSEVLTSRLAALVDPNLNDEEQQTFIAKAEQWNTTLLQNRISLPDDLIVDIVRIGDRMVQDDEEEDMSLLLDVVKGIYDHVSQGNIVPLTLAKKMDDTLESMQDKIQKLDMITNMLTDADIYKDISSYSNKSPNSANSEVKRKIKKANKGGAKPRVTINDMYSVEEGPKSPDIPPLCSAGPSTVNRTVAQFGQASSIKPMETSKTDANVQEKDKEISYDGVDPSSAVAKGLRDQFRKYYSTPTYDKMDDANKKAMMEYYGKTILRISDGWEKDPLLVQLVEDLTSKKTVFECIAEAQKGNISAARVNCAQVEFYQAVKVCGGAYGKMRCRQSVVDNIPIIYFVEVQRTPSDADTKMTGGDTMNPAVITEKGKEKETKA